MLFTKQTKSFTKLLWPALLLVLSLLIGLFGFMVIEGYGFIDALYMTAVTVSTVGYEVVKPLSYAGKLFTIFFLLINIGLFTYFIALFTRYLLDGEFIKRYKEMKMENKIHHLKDHVIICGFGRNGRESAQILHNNSIPFVIVENKDELETDGHFKIEHSVKGNATTDEILLEAGIKHAKAIITTLPVDADNLFLVLSARQLNPSIKIISRASVNSSVQKLKIAGADNVIMPDKIGGAHMATLVLQPDVTEILSIMSTTSNPSFRIVELPVGKSIKLAELDLWKKTHCTIIGLKKLNKHYSINPSPEYTLLIGDSLIIMGSEKEINQARELVS
ncbi:MAG: NAD-binding protein [Chitinophagaceae bacterium]|nr:NAD-binding protein [Chitinophagaceae bacterium]